MIAHQAIAKTAQSLAAIICTLFSIPMFLKAGAAPTNTIAPAARKDNTVKLLCQPPIESVISNQAGISRKAIENIISVKT